MKTSLFIVLFFMCLNKSVWSQNIDKYYFSGIFKNQTINEALHNISQVTPLKFSYQSNLAGLEKIIVYKHFNQKPVIHVLNEILENSGLVYEIYSGQIIIYENRTLMAGKMIIEGKLCKSGTQDPVPFAGIELKSARKGTISDEFGYFRMELEDSRLKDTLLVSSLNFNPVKIPVLNFQIPGMHTFYMSERTIILNRYDVSAPKGRLHHWGNKPFFASGSFYLDTHGQQTALFIANDTPDTCKLVSVNVYLSKRGNTDAPFRLHIYKPDTVSGKPGAELLPEMVIIKPDKGKGWFNINLSRYKIIIPPEGFFVAVEGIFPGDFDFFFDTDLQSFEPNDEEKTDDFESETISYGQQIGYSGSSENKTWHYSIDGNWFQLKKKHFNAMITAEVKVYSLTIKRGFLGLFKHKKRNR